MLKIRVSPLIVIFVVVFVNFLGFGLILPLLPFYAENLGASAVEIGSLMASYSLMQFLAAPILGRLSDRYGRRPILLVSIAGTVISFVLLGWGGSLVVVWLSRILDGLTGGNISTAQAVISDITDKKVRAKGMGIIGAAFGLGFVMGPAVGGYFAKFGYPVPAYIAAGTALMAWILTFLFLPETQSQREMTSKRARINWENLQVLWQNKVVRNLLGYVFLFASSFSLTTATVALFTARQFEFSVQETGYFFAYFGVLIVLVQGGLIGRIVARWGERRVLVVGLVLGGVGLVGMGLATSLWWLLFTGALMALGNGMFSPSQSGLVSQNTESELQGEVMGVNSSVVSLGNVVGPVVGGYLFQRFTPATPMVVGGWLLILTGGLAYVQLKRAGLKSIGRVR